MNYYSKQTQSNPILSHHSLGEGGFKSTISWVFSIWQLRFSILNFNRGECKMPVSGTADKNTFIRGRFLMRTWRSKLIFLLIVYFAGFATAIYCLAPVPENRDFKPDEKSFTSSVLKSDEFARSFNAGMHKCLDFGKDATRCVSTFLKEKLEDRNQADG